MRRGIVVCLVAGVLSPMPVAQADVLREFGPRPVEDARESDHPLDLRSVTFGQRATQLVLELRTHGEWSTSELAEDGLCFVLERRERRVGRLCVAAAGGAAALRYRRSGPDGRLGRARTVPAVVSRPDRRSLSARVHPRDLRLTHGAVQWAVISRPAGASHAGASSIDCAACGDRVPDNASRTATVSALAHPRCFGAAARAATRTCRNRELERAAIPTPDEALISVDGNCRITDDRRRTAVLRLCEFGSRDDTEPVRAALIGDSHAAHWRAAVDVVAQDRGWRAASMTRPGCTFSTEVYPAPEPTPTTCRRHTEQALAWLRAHPSVHTVFTSSSAGRGFGTAGFQAVWQRVPRTVRRIYVIRDVPRARTSTGACVMQTLRRRHPTARACAFSRGAATLADPSAAAAAATGGAGRVRLVDLTRHFCSPALCFPVVGGAYVYKDDNHMNATFASTLGPFLGARVRR